MQISSNMFTPRYFSIIAHLSEPAQQRIMAYANEVAHKNFTPQELEEHLGVKTFLELVQHLSEYESGTPYILEDPLISDYNRFTLEHNRPVTCSKCAWPSSETCRICKIEQKEKGG